MEDVVSWKWPSPRTFASAAEGTLGRRAAAQRLDDDGPCTWSSDDVVRVTVSTRQMSLPKGATSLEE